MPIQFLFIFANKEQSKGQKKINARPQEVRQEGLRVLSLDVKLRGFTFRRHEPTVCAVQPSSAPVCATSHVPTIAASLAIILVNPSLSSKE